MQVLPSDESVDAASALADTISKAKSGRQRWSDAAFGERERLWGALAAGEWTLIGAPGEDAFSLTDIAEIAVAWGSQVLPVPLTPTILVRRWSWDAGSPAWRPLTFGLPVRSDQARVPFADFPGVALMGPDGEVPLPSASLREEQFDLLMPTPPANVTVPSLTRRQVADVCSLSLAEAVGVAHGVLADTVDHAKSREQFGHPIATFQAVKHHCADMHIGIEIARAQLAAIINAPLGQDITPAVTDAFTRLRGVVERGLQIHGAMGFAWETGLHFGLRHVVGLGEFTAQALAAVHTQAKED
jgi:hypothetical protein